MSRYIYNQSIHSIYICITIQMTTAAAAAAISWVIQINREICIPSVD